VTPNEISAWKAEQQKKPLAERLATIPGYRAEAEAKPEASAEVTFEDVKRMQEPKQ
jgi:hypothetical protein